MPQRFTFLVAPCNEAGHFNACTGSSLALLARGHRVIFVINRAWAGQPSALGFEEFTYAGFQEPNTDPAAKVAVMLQQHRIIGPETPKEKLQNFVNYFESGSYEAKMVHLSNAVEEAIQKFRPDCIVIDDHSLAPSIHKSGLPWIKSCSMAPLFEVFDDQLPPGGSGEPEHGDRTQWSEFNRIRAQLFTSRNFNDYFEKLGFDRYPDDLKFPPTEILTVYAYPEELNFDRVRAKGWHNLEAFHKPDLTKKPVDLSTIVPKSFLDDDLGGTFSGHLIYFSLGSLGSIDVQLMSRLLGLMATTPHKYIVSKGPSHGAFSLPKNCWGGQYLAQTSIVPHVDLVITHGGNNTVTETFALGKPMIVLPLFVDQYDNAQRLTETGFGLKIDPYHFEDHELLAAIDQILKNSDLRTKCQTAAKRITGTKVHEEYAIKVEEILEKRG